MLPASQSQPCPLLNAETVTFTMTVSNLTNIQLL